MNKCFDENICKVFPKKEVDATKNADGALRGGGE